MDYNRNLNPEVRDITKNNTIDARWAEFFTRIFDKYKTGVINIWKEELQSLRNSIKTTQNELGIEEKTWTLSYITNTDKKAIREIAKHKTLTQSAPKSKWRVNTWNKPRVEEPAVETTPLETWIDTETIYTQQDIIEEAKGMSIRTKKLVQAFLWFRRWAGLDGNFWPNSFRNYAAHEQYSVSETFTTFIEKNSAAILACEKFLERPRDQSDSVVESWDAPLSSKEEFEANYGELMWSLEQDIGSPPWIGKAIASVESSYGQSLNSGTGSKWIMQLTVWPFLDMRWDHTPYKQARIPYADMEKVEVYRNIFKDIDFTKIKKINMWDGSTIGESMSEHIWEKLEKLQDDSIPSREASDIIDELKDLIKGGSKTSYIHTLNIIIGQVYYRYLEYSHGGDMYEALVRYNADTKIEKSDGRMHKYHYAEKVMKKFQEQGV